MSKTAEDFKIKYTRLATLRDTDRIVEMLSAFVKGTAFGRHPLDTPKIREQVEKFIVESPENTCLLLSVDKDDYPVGIIAGVTASLIFTNEEISMEVAWYVDPKADKLGQRNLELRAGFEEWSRRKGVRYAQYARMNPTAEDFSELENSAKSQILEIVYHRKVQ